MNKLGMAVDVSHAGNVTALDDLQGLADARLHQPRRRPRALWDIPRMKPDDVIKAVADTGGVIGIEAAPHTTLTASAPACTRSSP